MKLKTYLARNNISATAFAKRCKCSSQTIYNIVNGEHRTRIDIAMRISRETRGKVRLVDILDACGEQDEREPATAA